MSREVCSEVLFASGKPSQTWTVSRLVQRHLRGLIQPCSSFLQTSLRIFYALMETPPHSDSLELNGLQWFQRVNGEHLLKCQRTALSKECNLLSIESVEKIQNSKQHKFKCKKKEKFSSLNMWIVLKCEHEWAADTKKQTLLALLKVVNRLCKLNQHLLYLWKYILKWIFKVQQTTPTCFRIAFWAEPKINMTDEDMTEEMFSKTMIISTAALIIAWLITSLSVFCNWEWINLLALAGSPPYSPAYKENN